MTFSSVECAYVARRLYFFKWSLFKQLKYTPTPYASTQVKNLCFTSCTALLNDISFFRGGKSQSAFVYKYYYTAWTYKPGNRVLHDNVLKIPCCIFFTLRTQPCLYSDSIVTHSSQRLAVLTASAPTLHPKWSAAAHRKSSPPLVAATHCSPETYRPKLHMFNPWLLSCSDCTCDYKQERFNQERQHFFQKDTDEEVTLTYILFKVIHPNSKNMLY